VLDFACGTGVLSAWLADRGAIVTGIDLSPRSLERAREVAEHAAVAVELVLGDVSELGERTFDAIAGRYALHHVDVAAVAPVLGRALRPGGTGAFLETMATNRLLAVLRRHVAGRFGVPRHGTADEHPLGDDDLAVVARAFGGTVERRVGELVFLRLFDRQILAFRSRRASKVLGKADDVLLRMGRDRLSYHQVIVIRKPA
jgi:SAM-dependent methyltransferase